MFRTKLTIVGLTAALAAIPATPAHAAAGRPGVILQIERGGKAISVVTANGRTERVKLSSALPRGVRVGSRVVVAKSAVTAVRGASKAVKLRATVAMAKGKVTALLPTGAAVTSVIPSARMNISGMPAGKPVAVLVKFLSGGRAVATVAAPGDYSDPYADPYTDPYVDPSPPTDAADCAAAATPVKVISINRATLRIMVQDGDGQRVKYKVSANVLATLHRGLDVVVTDADSDGSAESVVIAARGGRHGRQITGSVDWIDTDWGAFGLSDGSGRVRVVNASACQLASIAEGDSVTVTAHRDADGELVADTVEQTSTGASTDEGDESEDDGAEEDDDAGDDGAAFRFPRDAFGSSGGHGHHGRGGFWR